MVTKQGLGLPGKGERGNKTRGPAGGLNSRNAGGNDWRG